MAVSQHSPTHRQERADVPPFVPHPLLRGGHAQTVFGRYLIGPRISMPSLVFEQSTGDGDVLVGLASTPPRWRVGDPAAILVHGLSGCAEAPYVRRVADLLHRRGIRVVRMNLRGAGRGFGKARGVYHAGRSEDVRRIVEWTERNSKGSPIALVGFSLGGNLVLKLAAEAVNEPATGLDCVIAANPPIDLADSCRHIQRPSGRWYDRNFVKLLTADVHRLHRRFPELGPVTLPRVVSLYEFDEHYTAPRNGFESADDYYRRSSSATLIERITLPGLVIHAADDPFIPVEPFHRAAFPRNLVLELTTAGGHLGYLSRTPWRGSRRWLDQRIAHWLEDRWRENLRAQPGPLESLQAG